MPRNGHEPDDLSSHEFTESNLPPPLNDEQLDYLSQIPVDHDFNLQLDQELEEKFSVPLTKEGLIDPRSLNGLSIPLRQWISEGLIPYHVPTMLSGAGGIGKTLLGMQLVHSAASNLPWLNRPIRPVKAFAVFCEDDEAEVHRRFNDINTGTGVRFNELANLRYWVRDGMVSGLLNFDGKNGAGKETQFFYDLMDEIKYFGAQLILLDSLYNFFHGNENDRVQVTQFVGLLRRMAKQANAALVFLAHPSKAGLSTGDGYAGSTAWHDAVRSRLYFSQDENEETGEKRLLLTTMKANYAAKGDAIEVYYEGGMLKTNEPPQTEPVTRRLQAEIAFLKCLRDANAARRNVSDKTRSSNYAPKRFVAMGLGFGFRTKDFERAMHSLFDQKRIEVNEFVDTYRNKKEAIFEVEKAQNTAKVNE